MLLKNLFLKQKEHLDFFYHHLDMEQCEKVLHEIYACKGVLFFTGVGKSGYVAQKVAATMLSTGTKAFFLAPIDAIHGDLGMISNEDLILIFSKSGETDELLQLLPYIRSKQARVCAIISNTSSRLAKGVDFFANLPCERELCPFDLAPTTSTEIQLLFGDVIAIALMQAKGFGLEEYAKNHPGGRVGRRATMKVRDLMLDKQRSPICLPEHRLEEVLLDFTNKRCGCLVVIDENKRLKGIFTDGDLRRALQIKGEQVLKEKMQDLMTQSPKAIEADTVAWEAMKLMESDQKHPVMVLPVLEKGEVIGIIKMHDLIQANL